jgi:hypothetical protein
MRWGVVGRRSEMRVMKGVGVGVGRVAGTGGYRREQVEGDGWVGGREARNCLRGGAG